jgi:hypothetical protein
VRQASPLALLARDEHEARRGDSAFPALLTRRGEASPGVDSFVARRVAVALNSPRLVDKI